MVYIVVPLFNVELGTVLFPLEVDLLEVQQVLVVLSIDLLDLLLQKLMLVVLDHLRPKGFHLLQLLAELCLDSSCAFYLLFESCNFCLNSTN